MEEFERAARGHWGVENSLHWQLDFTFGDDKNTSMAKTCAKNLQTTKKVTLSVLRLVRDSYKISMKRIRYDLSRNINNTDVRNLFGLSAKESYKASRIIKDTVEAQLLRPLDDTTAPRYMKYIPYWA